MQIFQNGAVEVAKPAGPKGAEKALDLTLSRGLESACVDQCHSQPGADQGEMARAVGASVIDVETRRQEGRVVLGQGEAGEGDHPGGIVYEGDQVGLAPTAALPDLGSVHDVAHPKLARLAIGEAPPVGTAGRRGPVEKPLAGQKPVYRGRGERMIDPFVLCRLDDGPHRTGGVPGFQRDQAIGDLGRQAPGLAAIGTGLRIKRIEAAAAGSR